MYLEIMYGNIYLFHLTKFVMFLLGDRHIVDTKAKQTKMEKIFDVQLTIH